LEALAFDSRITSHSNATLRDAETATPCAQKQRNITIGLGS